MAKSISNSDDIIDSRDVIARIEELASEHETLAEAVTDAKAALAELAEAGDPRDAAIADVEAAELALDEFTGGDDGEELAALRKLADEGENYAGDWQHGAALINDSHFVEYAQELAEDIGAIGKDAPWPACHIDWDAAADALKADYSSIDFNGTEFWVRS